eukprot:1413950-Pyramimonas_sp.AAC.1
MEPAEGFVRAALPPAAPTGNILTMRQSDARSAGIFSRCANQTREAHVYSHDGPIQTWLGAGGQAGGVGAHREQPPRAEGDGAACRHEDALRVQAVQVAGGQGRGDHPAPGQGAGQAHARALQRREPAQHRRHGGQGRGSAGANRKIVSVLNNTVRSPSVSRRHQ